MAAIVLDIESAFHTIWHAGLLYKLSKFDFLNQFDEAYYFFSFTKKIQFR
jgi:hypothetical protein